jgi:hypothetical protein
MSSSDRVSRAAPRFSVRWSTDLVPGMGSTTGDFCSSQASATCDGVASSSRAMSATGLSGAARSPVAIGNHGMKPMPSAVA